MFITNLIENITENEKEIEQRIGRLRPSDLSNETIYKIISLLDLTSLSGTDTPKSIESLLFKAKHPVVNEDVQTASVCIYQPFIKQSVTSLRGTDIGIATVAGGFPAGQMSLDIKCADIEKSVSMGATEIDVVISRTNPLTDNWKGLYDEVAAFKKSCSTSKLKVIIATGELDDYSRIAKTSMVCLMAGADFIKTSTGLEKVNATLEAGYVMMKAINSYFKETGRKAGFKPAGGIRTTGQALLWMQLVIEELGDDWFHKPLFRFGASSLLDDLVHHLK